MKTILYKIASQLYSSAQKSGPGLSQHMVADYNAARRKPTSVHICHAPFTNMYFNVHGDCAPCWLTFINPDSYPAKSIKEIWFGENYQTMRDSIQGYNLTSKCNVCLKNLQVGNYTSVLARAYDINEPASYPAMIELELSNTCNLECVMCIGELSSSIRKNRERLPAMKNAYDDAFVDQLEEFIPHLRELRFNGGEPFLINAVFKIFEKVEKLNPELKIVIATNGTILNYKVKEWLNKLNIHINFSLDSLTPSIYETIRVNAHFDRVIEHFNFYHQYTKQNKRTMCLMVNPLRNNWHEMPDFVRFVNKHNINLWFNTIHRPAEWAIWSLPAAELEQVYTTLSTVEFTKEERKNTLAPYNLGIYNNLVTVQIKNWLHEAKERNTQKTTESEIPTEEDAYRIIENKLINYLQQHSNQSEDQKKHQLQLLSQKLMQINKLLNERNRDINFYGLIFNTPADVLYTSLDTRSVNSLVEDFENYMMQAVA